MFGMTTLELIALGVALGILVMTPIVMVLRRKKKKPVLPHMDVEQLLQALGGSSNLLSLSREHQRIKVTVKDLKKVQQPLLKTLNIPAFLKGKELTLLIQHHPSHALSYLSERQKEA
jgi:hypothetical protein